MLLLQSQHFSGELEVQGPELGLLLDESGLFHEFGYPDEMSYERRLRILNDHAHRLRWNLARHRAQAEQLWGLHLGRLGYHDGHREQPRHAFYSRQACLTIYGTTLVSRR